MADRSRRNDPADSSGQPEAPTPGATPVDGLEPPVLDLAAFGQVATVLPSEAIASYFRTITERGDALLRDLNGAAETALDGAELVTATHALAGSAGLLGFKRLAMAARNFEQGVQSGMPEAPVLVHALMTALEATLREIRARTPAAMEA